MAGSSIVFENGEEFARALLANPTKQFLAAIVLEASEVVQAERRKNPAQTGSTPGTIGKSSTGNIKTLQRSYYARTVGSFYVRKDGSQTASKKRSQDLSNSWERQVSNGGLTISVQTQGVDYAGWVRGGRDETQKQTSVMKRRGWDSVDVIAKTVEGDIGQIVEKSLGRLYREYFASRGITAT